MKYLTIAFLFVALMVSAQEVATESVPVFTWEKTLNVNAGQSFDLVVESVQGFSIAVATINGRVKVNGNETTYVSWCPNSIVKCVAISSATIVLKGN